ncbi:amino acid adenylation domain-containing protein [Kitasatospora sp. NPDC056138]|uniref:amino acid adenylation domain-containing protein n=1 Tax=Kitasatospora sp. NPDC056138 TaxID=3345724 RepID=UPI0035D576F7
MAAHAAGQISETAGDVVRLGVLLAEVNDEFDRDLESDDPLFLESLDATEFKSAIDAEFGVDVPLELFFGTCTLGMVADALRNLAPAEGAAPVVLPAPERRFEPFPLTAVQQAYWLGSRGFDLGGRSAHFYLEIDLFAGRVEQAEEAFNRLIGRHDMLRAVVLPDGRQRVLSETPYYRFRHADLRDLPEPDGRCRLEETREELAGQVFDPHTWPLYEIRTHELPGDRLRLHVSIDLLFVDAGSLQLLLTEWIRLVLDPGSLGPAPEVTFRDYLEGVAEQRRAPGYEQAREYWLARVDSLPPAPELPVQPPAHGGAPVFVRRQHRVPGHTWRRLRDRAGALGVTPSVLLCTAYADVLRTWSKTARFTVNLTLAERPRWHQDIHRLIGDFTSTILLECDLSGRQDLSTAAVRIQAQLREDLRHARFGGVEVQRELARRRDGVQARMPVVFTSLLREQDSFGALEGVVFRTGYAVSQTPQVYLDNQVMVVGSDLVVSWDAVAEMFPDGVLDDMFAAYLDLLERIAEQDAPAPAAPPRRQLDVRAAVNATRGAFPQELIHTAFDRQVAARGDAPAVITAERTLGYRELDRRANQIAHRLRGLGAAPNTLVAVVMHKGWEQVAAVLGVVRSGAAYLPVDAGLPPERTAQLIAAGRATVVLTQPGVRPPEGVTALVVGPQPWPDVPDVPVKAPSTTPEDLAYVIFTSGSTGRPKGVMISHRSAVNTLDDVTTRFAVTRRDRVLGLSALNFDLSVYDVFGVLGAGGALVLPAPGESRDPGRWAELADEHGVTLWNTVPALLELLVEHCEGQHGPFPASLRLALLSGDWIPVSLPGRVSALGAAGRPALVGLGGATEAAIWSIHHPIDQVDPAWRSIPYGTPLRNQTFHVLDADLAAKPDHVTGELYIGGAGVAEGYWADPERTAERFLTHPRTGERLYRTGDLGRYRPDGSIEFLGRDDFQVKIGGHRIELGEIEVVLGHHPAVRSTVVVAKDARRLVAYVVPEPGGDVAEDELRDHLAAKLPSYMVPSAFVALDALPLGPNGKLDRAALPEPAAAADDFEPPATEVERVLAGAWAAVLPGRRIGRHDDFFSLGGDSLLGVRAVAKAAEHGLHLTLRDFYGHPTIAEQAKAVRELPATTAPQSTVTGRVGLSPSQRWFFEQEFTAADHWNGMWPVFRLDRPLDTALLEEALVLVLGHHDGLRAQYLKDDRGWHARFPERVAEDAARVETVDLRTVPDGELEQAISRHVDRRNSSLDLATGRTVRLTCFDLGPDRGPRLLISAHWLVMDYYSSRVFYEDLRTAYFALERGEGPVLPAKTASLPQCIGQLDAYAASEELAAELPYWTEIAELPPTTLPVDHRRGPNVQSSAVRHFVEITGDTAAALVTGLPRRRGVEVREVLLTALVRAVTAWTGRPDLVVELEGHGRQQAFDPLDTSRTVARFSTLSPVLLRPGGLTEVRDQVRAVPHRGVGYGVLRHLHPDPEVRARLAGVPAPEIGFNFWGDVSEYFTGDARPVVESFGHHRSGLGARPRVLDVMALTSGGELRMVWTYSSNLHTEATVRALADRVTEELHALAKDAG